MSSSVSIPTHWPRRWFRVSGIRASLLFYSIFVRKEVHFHLSWTLRSQIVQSINERWWQVTRIRFAEKIRFLNQVWLYRYRGWNVFPNPCSCFGILEIFIFHKDWFEVKNSHVVKEFLDVCMNDTKRVKFVKQCFTESIQFLGKIWFKWFKLSIVSPGFRLYYYFDHTIGNDKLQKDYWHWINSKCDCWNVKVEQWWNVHQHLFWQALQSLLRQRSVRRTGRCSFEWSLLQLEYHSKKHLENLLD